MNNSFGQMSVSGVDSTYINHDSYALYSAILKINYGGFVRVGGSLIIESMAQGIHSIDMSTGGQLALFGKGDDSLSDFVTLIEGEDNIRYWDGSDWEDLTLATNGEDYWLKYMTEGDHAGFTDLTVGVIPEPASLSLLVLGGALLLRRRQTI